MDMAMNGIVGAVLGEQFFELPAVLPHSIGVQATMNLRTQRADFILVNTRLGLMHEEIHRHFVAVRVAQCMQQPCLGPAPVQGTQDMQHTAWTMLIQDQDDNGTSDWAEERIALSVMRPAWDRSLATNQAWQAPTRQVAGQIRRVPFQPKTSSSRHRKCPFIPLEHPNFR